MQQKIQQSQISLLAMAHLIIYQKYFECFELLFFTKKTKPVNVICRSQARGRIKGEGFYPFDMIENVLTLSISLVPPTHIAVHDLFNRHLNIMATGRCT